MKRYIAIVLLIITLFLTACTPNDTEIESDSESTGKKKETTETVDIKDSQTKDTETKDTETSDTGNQDTESDDGKSDVESDSGDAENTVKKYTLTYTNAEGGKIIGTLVQQVEEGKDGTAVKAVADEGYKFVQWSDGYKFSSRFEYKVKSDLSVYPIFTINPQDVLDAPIIRINTENKAPIKDKENYVTCTVDVSNTDEEACMTAVPAGIRGRGNSSWMWHDKKSFRIKFDKKQSMFGSEYKAKSWTLIANHADRTLSRNALAHELASRLDDIAFASMHQHVEVYLNDEYLGLYLLCDQMQTGEGRVDIEESKENLDPETELPLDVDTGYLIEMDGRHNEDGKEGHLYFIGDYDKQYGLKTPDADDIPDDGHNEYLEFIEGYITDCLDALSAEDWELITSLIDVNSFADAFIVQELFGNIDVGTFSFYMYKPKSDKLYCGPLWDFDLSVGSVDYGYGNEQSWAPDADLQKIKAEAIADGKSEEEINSGMMLAERGNTWFRRLMRNEEFVALVKEKLEKYDETILSVISLADPKNPEGYYAKYQYSMARNFERWDILGEYVWPNNKDVYSITTVEESFIYVRDWLTVRYGLLKARVGLN